MFNIKNINRKNRIAVKDVGITKTKKKMGNYRLTANRNAHVPVAGYVGKELREGFTFVVAAQSTTGPNMDEVRGALINLGFSLKEADAYVNSSYNNYFKCEKISDQLDWKLVEEQRNAINSAREEKWESERNAKKEFEQKTKENEGSKKGGFLGKLFGAAVGIAALAADAANSSDSKQSKEKKSSGLFGGANKPKEEKKSSGLFGSDNKPKEEKKSGLFGGGNKPKEEKKSGMFGGDNKRKEEKRSGGLMGGSSKSSGGGLGLGGKKKKR